MKATMESTAEIVTVDGVRGRIWKGTTEGGVEFTALVHRVAVHKDADASEFERELQEQAPPLETHAFRTRML